MSFIDPILDSVDIFLAWLSTSLKQTTESYCDLQTADSPTVLVANDGSLVSIIRVFGVTSLIGREEFERLYQGFATSMGTAMSRPGHALQVYFNYDRDGIRELLTDMLLPAKQTAERLNLKLDDLFDEQVSYLSKYCAKETMYLVLWSRPSALSKEQFSRAEKEKLKVIREQKIPRFTITQNIIAAIPELRNAHDSFVRSSVSDLTGLGLMVELMEVHEALHAVRKSVDSEFTDRDWSPSLPGDSLPVRVSRAFQGEVSDILWPSLAKQLLPRDAETLDLRTVRLGDRIYSCVYIDLFPKDLKSFINLFQRALSADIPWRMSFLMESQGLNSLSFKATLSAILSFSSAQNRLISDSQNLLSYIQLNTDDSVVKLRVAAATWAAVGEERLLRVRAAELSKAIQGWGTCEVSEISGDPFGGVVSSMLAVSADSVAVPTIAPLSQVSYMLPITRPASPWDKGALLLRTPDGKPWPYQPGSSMQPTWIDLIYARPGSGKSVLSNALNLALCLSGGIVRLPRIAIVDIGPSSSGLISLLKEALPTEQRHLVAYHRLRMTPDYSVNPFDTQLGARFPTPQERGFLVNFLTLLATPMGSRDPYDGMPEMTGMVVDELYKSLADGEKPYRYNSGVEPLIDGVLVEIGFTPDPRTTWWEVTDALFMAGFPHEAMLSQRYAVPLVADAASVCRSQAIEDLYGKIKAPTGEDLPSAFARMISSAVREYPILSQVTSFDLGDARVVSLDLDEVAKSGGEAADRQTAVMYMLARQVLARHYYLTDENLEDMPKAYHDYHRQRIAEIKEDHKRIVYDEFHRTAGAKAVREQVIVDMREGRKWRVEVALISQSLDDFDSVMVEFATSVYIMDAGPEATIQKAGQIFGLSETAKVALRTRVHGPREGGGTFLAQFSTKYGKNTQLLTCTLGPVELWAFSTTVEDMNIRNQMYQRIGPVEARRLLATLFPGGTVTKLIERRLNSIRETGGMITDDTNKGVLDQLVQEILDAYAKDPNVKRLPNS